MSDVEIIRDAPPIPPVVAAAIVAACSELSNLAKTQTAIVNTKGGDRYSYSYNDLADVVALARPILARHGLALIQPVMRQLGRPVEVDTWLLHESGHMLRWTFEANGDGGPQALGSAITYARRYCAQAALGIASEGADDDGQAANVTPMRTTSSTSTQSPLDRKAMALFRGLGIVDRDTRIALTAEILGRDVDSWNDLGAIEKRRVVDALARREADDESDET